MYIYVYMSSIVYIYRVYKKKRPKYKIASKLDICKNYIYQQQPAANIGHQMCISVNFVFIC